MAELLVELFSEEIPARMQAQAAADLQRLVGERLAAAGVPATSLSAFATPRRLAVMADGVAIRQPDLSEERRGPRVGAPDAAIEGFLRSAGLERLDQCERREAGKGEFWFAVLHREGGATIDLLGKLIGEAVTALPWPKSMRFGARTMRWVRPLHSVLAVFDGRPVPGTLDLGGGEDLVFGDSTRGHRFLAPDAFAVTGFADYRDGLAAARVILDAGARAERIRAGIVDLATARGLTIPDDPGLLAEVAGLVEWPVPLMGRIDDAFMDLPREVLTTAMRAHQRYFATQSGDGAMAPWFVTVANVEAADGGRAIIAGNERVLRARLADARFFWDQDRRTPLRDRVPRLAERIFHARLGTLADKVVRIEALAVDLAAAIPGAARDLVRGAAALAKADLASGMVGEFPELQGVMGRYYALADGEDPAVADAIRDHYAPLGPGDAVPSAPVTVAVALADKIDSLVGFFAIGETPTGSKDPFALRRAALGVIRLVLDNGLRLDLGEAFRRAHGLYGDGHPGFAAVALDAAGTDTALRGFLADRLKVHLRGQGVRHDLISAAFSVGGEGDLVRLLARVEALTDFLGTGDGANLLVAYRRASNIVRIEERKDKAAYDAAPDPAVLAEPEEQELGRMLPAAAAAMQAALAREDFGSAMQALAGLRGPVDAFFDRVTVNAPDPALRANRLRLLSAIRATMNRVADFSRIEG